MSAVRLMRWTDQERLAFEGARDVAPPGFEHPRGPAEPSDLERAEALYRQQRLRETTFPSAGLFQDPAWDLILDLFIAHARGTVLSVTGACEGARLPSTTGLRWLKTLEERKMIMCWRDARDRRRRLVKLLPETVEDMRVFLANL